ncbi:MAG TPA: hypothetical protein VN808_17430 [Stellaceae bacterium]|nr:hypothetical protein [Stellaceae bacterium]
MRRRDINWPFVDTALVEGTSLRAIARELDIPVTTLHRKVEQRKARETSLKSDPAEVFQSKVEHPSAAPDADPEVLVAKSRAVIDRQLDELATAPTALSTRSGILRNITAAIKTIAESGGGKKVAAKARAQAATRAGKYAPPATPPGLLHVIEGGKK